MISNNLDHIFQVTKGIGYSSLPKIDEKISSFILQEIEKQLKKKFLEICPNKIHDLKNNSIISSYKIIDSKIWTQLLTKDQRALNKNAVLVITKYLKSYLSDVLKKEIIFDDYLGLGYPSLSLRVVRPNFKNDVGALHTDQWFIDMGSQPLTKSIKNYELIKLWLPIKSHPKLSNLLVIPNSHKEKDLYKFKIIKTENGERPSIANDIDINKLIMIDNPPRKPLIFNMGLIHGGSLNKDKVCRISMELLFYVAK